MQTQHGGGIRQRPSDIVSVANEDQMLSIEFTEDFFDRHHIGQRLARMELIGQTIDDRAIGMLGKIDNELM